MFTSLSGENTNLCWPTLTTAIVCIYLCYLWAMAIYSVLKRLWGPVDLHRNIFHKMSLSLCVYLFLCVCSCGLFLTGVLCMCLVYMCVFRSHLLNAPSSFSVIHESSLCTHTSACIICHDHALVCNVMIVPFSQQQIRKLRRELESSQEKVANLTCQLSANVCT